MSNKIISILILVLIAKTAIFAQENDEFPRNSLSFDGGSLMAYLLATSIIYDTEEKGPVMIVASAQYEYQFLPAFSLAGRLEYKSFNYTDGLNLTSLSTQAHARYYPYEKSFFTDLILGYAFFYMTDMPLSHFFKLGANIGWRIDFKTPGGFFIEPYFGYSISFGKSNVNFSSGNEPPYWRTLVRFLNLSYDILIRGFFVSGPVYGLGLGYRF